MSTSLNETDHDAFDVPSSGAAERRVSRRPGMIRRVGRFLRRLGPAGPLAVAVTALPPIGAVGLLGAITLAAPSLQQYRWAPLACAAIFALAGGLSLLPTYALSIVAGWSFGVAVGLPTSAAGIVAAACVGYAVARFISGRRLLAIIDERPSWRVVHHALLGGGFWHAVWIITLLRLSPVPTFGLTNLILGAAHVKPGRFVLGTTIGMSPYAVVMVLAGAGLQQMSFKAAEQPWLIAGGIVALIVAVTVIGRVARRALEGVAQEDALEHPEFLEPDPPAH